MKVLAALSGGVDSAVAAARAVEAGHEVTAVHMALSAEPASCRVGARGCCSVEDANDARRVAAALGIPFYVWDLAETFKQTVIADFLAEYRAGRTPNPCLRCNEFVKFRELSNRAAALGFDAVCTGHYAKIVDGPQGLELHRAADALKDQSYVLAVMPREQINHCLFPLGDVTSKAQVRAEAAERGLVVSEKPDSYDICFIPDGDTAGFLERNLGAMPGEIIDSEGQVLGTHQGFYSYTVGQRKGLGLTVPAPDGRPRYVLSTDPQRNTVTVGAQELLRVNRIDAESTGWLIDPASEAALRPLTSLSSLQPQAPQADTSLRVQFRAHGEALAAELYYTPQGQVAAILEREVTGIAAGQSLVIYRGTQVIAQATISGARRELV